MYYFIIMTSCRVKIREKIRRERKIDFSSRFHVDADYSKWQEGHAMSEVEETWKGGTV